MSTEDSDPLEVLSVFAEESARAVEDVKAQVSGDDLREAARLIGAARTVSVAGRDSAYPIAAFLLEGLRRLGYPGRLLRATDREERRHVASLHPRHVLVAVSFGKACPLAEFIPIAHQRGVNVLGITDSPASPVARNSDLSILLQTDTRLAFQPLAPYFVLVQVLLMALEDKRSH